jgi:hypothetical protein
LRFGLPRLGIEESAETAVVKQLYGTATKKKVQVRESSPSLNVALNPAGLELYDLTPRKSRR